MKAVVNFKYGSPNVLELKDVEKPVPNDNQVLVKVYAASVNPLDWHSLRGKPFLVRMEAGLLKPKHTILGADIAGRVEAVGSNVTGFKPGDEVFGGSGIGGFAEYVCTNEKALVLKPANISFEQAAAVPVAALTALQALRNKRQLQPEHKVLVNGAAGGVGTFAVQIAKSLGAQVTGVCSTRNLDMVRSIGADHVIDYTQQDFTQNGQRYDLILDNVGNISVSGYRRILTPNGIGVVVGFANLFRLFQVIIGARLSRGSDQKIGPMMANINKEDLSFINALLTDGKIVPVIDRCYPLSETAEAIRYLEAGHARGKVIITIEKRD